MSRLGVNVVGIGGGGGRGQGLLQSAMAQRQRRTEQGITREQGQEDRQLANSQFQEQMDLRREGLRMDQQSMRFNQEQARAQQMMMERQQAIAEAREKQAREIQQTQVRIDTLQRDYSNAISNRQLDTAQAIQEKIRPLREAKKFMEQKQAVASMLQKTQAGFFNLDNAVGNAESPGQLMRLQQKYIEGKAQVLSDVARSVVSAVQAGVRNQEKDSGSPFYLDQTSALVHDVIASRSGAESSQIARLTSSLRTGDEEVARAVLQEMMTSGVDMEIVEMGLKAAASANRDIIDARTAVLTTGEAQMKEEDPRGLGPRFSEEVTQQNENLERQAQAFEDIYNKALNLSVDTENGKIRPFDGIVGGGTAEALEQVHAALPGVFAAFAGLSITETDALLTAIREGDVSDNEAVVKARAMLDEYVTDPEMREFIAEQIEGGEGRPGALLNAFATEVGGVTVPGDGDSPGIGLAQYLAERDFGGTMLDLQSDVESLTSKIETLQEQRALELGDPQSGRRGRIEVSESEKLSREIESLQKERDKKLEEIMEEAVKGLETS